ncbi:hypothetical protein FZCC0188_11655 [Rhodobacterales bacterium FZCC0188]|nr:hypothetical protein [Rhodobacterales bacterium FZCC0188]
MRLYISSQWKVTIPALTAVAILLYVGAASVVKSDAKIYIALFDALSKSSFVDGFTIYQATVDGSREYLYYLVVWVASQGISRDIFILFFNLCLFISSWKLLESWNLRKPTAFLFIFFSYYHSVMYFSSERLKFGLLLVILSLLAHGKSRFILASASPLFHMQSLMLLFVVVVSSVRLKIPQGGKFIITLLSIFSAAGIIGYYILDQAIYKISLYINFGVSLYHTAAVFSLYIIAFLFTRNKINLTLSFFAILALSFIFESSRVNFLFYFYFLYFISAHVNSSTVRSSCLLVLFLFTFYKWLHLVYSIVMCQSTGCESL